MTFINSKKPTSLLLSLEKAFFDAVAVTGIVLTKMDGTSKGGIILSIMNELHIPVKFVCVGEGMDDLIPFESKTFAEALFK